MKKTKDWTGPGKFKKGLELLGACKKALNWVGEMSLEEAWSKCTPDMGVGKNVEPQDVEYPWLGFLLNISNSHRKRIADPNYGSDFAVIVAKLGLAYIGKRRLSVQGKSLKGRLEAIAAGAPVGEEGFYGYGFYDDWQLKNAIEYSPNEHMFSIVEGLQGQDIDEGFLCKVRNHIKECVDVDKLKVMFNDAANESFDEAARWRNRC